MPLLSCRNRHSGCQCVSLIVKRDYKTVNFPDLDPEVMARNPESSSAASHSASPAELYALIRRVRPLHRTLVRLVEQTLADTGLSRPMRAVLEQLEEQGALTVPQISRTLSVRRQFVQRVVNDLIAAGLVQRRRNVAHRRSWLIEPTPAGHDAFTRIHRREWQVLEGVGARVDPERLAIATEMLDQLTREAQAMEAGAGEWEGEAANRPDGPA